MSAFLGIPIVWGEEGHATSSEFNLSSEFVFSSALGPNGWPAGLFSRAREAGNAARV
jgi:hypothetical protein